MIIDDMFSTVALDLCVVLGRCRCNDVRVAPVFEDLDCELANRAPCAPDNNWYVLVLRRKAGGTWPRQLQFKLVRESQKCGAEIRRYRSRRGEWHTRGNLVYQSDADLWNVVYGMS